LKLAARTKALEAFLEMARYLEVKIRVGGFALPDALEECSHRFTGQWTGSYAGALAARYRARSPARGIWLIALQGLKGFEEPAALAEEDCQMIALFGDQLAGSDLKAIGENYGFLYSRMEERIQLSEKDSKVKGRLYRTIGSLAGLAIAIVIA
jgi:hypothetical protein